MEKEREKNAAAAAALADRGIVRNPSLSTINEERSSQISVYESAVSEASGLDEEKADVSVSIDGKEVSLSLYETPDISEAEAKQIAEIYADEISDHLSGMYPCMYSNCTGMVYVDTCSTNAYNLKCFMIMPSSMISLKFIIHLGLP